METFKIIVIIFLILLTYQIYQLNCTVYKEGFEGTPQSVGGIDDSNSINTLAQISKQLMTGGLTVPGNMNVSGNTNVTGDSKITGALGVDKTLNVTGNTTLGSTLNVTGSIIIKDGALDIKPAGDWGSNLSLTGGNKEAPFVNFMNKADGKRNGFIKGDPDKFFISNNVEIGGNILTVGGRNILAEIDKMKGIMKGELLNLLPGTALFSINSQPWNTNYPLFANAVKSL